MGAGSTKPPAGDGFPVTRWSAIRGAQSDDPAERQRALDRIAAAYWKPVYKYVRAKWGKSPEDAQDLTQDFFATLIEKDVLAGYDPGRARLRTFLRACIDAQAINAHRQATRLKRGGGAPTLSLEFELAEGELARSGLPAAGDIEAFFEREAARSLFGMAVDRLRDSLAERGKGRDFELFRRHMLDESDPRPSYAELAAEFGLSLADVTNRLFAVRRDFRRITLDLLREMTASESEFRQEARSLLGVTP